MLIGAYVPTSREVYGPPARLRKLNTADRRTPIVSAAERAQDLCAAPLTVRRIARNVLDRITFRQSVRGRTILRGAPSPILPFRHPQLLDLYDTALPYELIKDATSCTRGPLRLLHHTR